MKPSFAPVIMLLLVSLSNTVLAIDPFADEFAARARGHDYELSLRSDGGRIYEGYLRIDDRSRPLDARRFGDRLVGRAGRAGDAVGLVIETRGMGLLMRLGDEPPLFLRRR